MTRGKPYRQATTAKAINGQRDTEHVSFYFAPEQKAHFSSSCVDMVRINLTVSPEDEPVMMQIYGLSDKTLTLDMSVNSQFHFGFRNPESTDIDGKKKTRTMRDLCL